MVLTATRDGVTLQACVVLDGLNVKGTWKVYGYPSTAITDNTTLTAASGWDDWKLPDGRTTLADLREIYRRRR